MLILPAWLECIAPPLARQESRQRGWRATSPEPQAGQVLELPRSPTRIAVIPRASRALSSSERVRPKHQNPWMRPAHGPVCERTIRRISFGRPRETERARGVSARG